MKLLVCAPALLWGVFPTFPSFAALFLFLSYQNLEKKPFGLLRNNLSNNREESHPSSDKNRSDFPGSIFA